MKLFNLFQGMMLAAALFIATGSVAQAKTNVIVTNVTGADIVVGNRTISNKAYQWTELKALVTLPDGNLVQIIDPSSRCSTGWSIVAQGGGILPSATCVDIPFGQIGCVAAYVRKSTVPGFAYKIEMIGVSGSFCLDGWAKSEGSAMLDRAADEVERFADTAIEFIGGINDLKSD